MFDGTKNVVVNGGVFLANAEGAPRVNLDQVFSGVARNAILNADGRADEVRCHPGTREEVIGKIETWMNDKGRRIMWLSGPAGAGKSAICQTVAERCHEHEQHEANFFFFRADGTRNRAQPLVATLVYQLRRLYPALDVHLTDCLAADPLIFSASIQEQFIRLISLPIQRIRHSTSINEPIVLILDGLDECDDERKQEQILAALCALANAENSPFLVLVASRAEHHLVMHFNRIGSLAESIFLGDDYRPQHDIHHFVVAKFDEIKTAHSLARTLSKDWPSEADISAITDKSSGQFIYAATVMRFIRQCPDSPALSLRTILGMRTAALTGHSPFAQLDAVYSYILSKARDVPAIKLILSAWFMGGPYAEFFTDLLGLVGYEVMEIESLMADLGAIIQVASGSFIKLVFYHASFSDYLWDKSRSGIYHVNKREIAAELSSICLRNFYDEDTIYLTVHVLQRVEMATATLSESLLNASSRKLNKRLGYLAQWYLIIRALNKLYHSETDKEMLENMLQSWVRFGCRNGITNLTGVNRELSPSALKYYKKCLTAEQLKTKDGNIAVVLRLLKRWLKIG